MIARYRNRAFLEIFLATVLSGLFATVFHKATHMGRDSDNWNALWIVLYLAAYAMWVMASLSLAKAKGYERDAMGALFMMCFIVGFCIPLLPILFPFFIIFGLEDKIKRRMHDSSER
jgi:hypothetical protein